MTPGKRARMTRRHIYNFLLTPRQIRRALAGIDNTLTPEMMALVKERFGGKRVSK